MTNPASDFDRLDEAPPYERGELVRFAKTAIRLGKVAFEPGLADPTAKRKVTYDPGVHTPDQAIDALTVTVEPLNPRYQIIEREYLVPGVEWDILRESLRARDLHLRDLDGAYVQARWTTDRRLGKYTDRNGTERDRTALVVDQTFATAQECQAAADAFYAERRGGAPTGATAAPPPAPSTQPATVDQTTADVVERGTLLAFLPALAKGKTRAQFFEAIAADARFRRHFGPTDPDVLAVLERAGVPAATET